MNEHTALYERQGDAFVGTGATKGTWHEDGQAGGAVLALLGHVLEDVPSLTPMSLSRLSVDIVRPVPVGAPIQVATEIVRQGKKIQVVELTVSAGEAACTRARALRIRDADLTTSGGHLPASTSTYDPAAGLPPKEDLEGVEDKPGVADFLCFGADFLRTYDPVDGNYGLRVGMRIPVIAGEPIRPTSRATLAMDCVNLIGIQGMGMGEGVSLINADVSGHIFRLPHGDWIAMMGHTYFDHTVGHGVSMATMSDRDGIFGVTSTSQIVQRVG